ncbi:MAG: hypothetical protein LBC53_06080 [Spirochaetaceae bacterium]|jgi:hypothetical protein|nr:hypothetical protein [Spirochaetaceae bacterium]
MRGEKTSFEQLLSVMPDGWEAKAKELGALARGREIKNALDLLRLVFLYLTEGKSFSGTAALLEFSGICAISKKAVFARFQKCGEWLRRLCERIYRNNEAIIEPTEWLGERKVYMVDASDEPVHGSDKADYWLRYAIGLFDLGMKEMALTGTGLGEKGHSDGGPCVLRQTGDGAPVGKGAVLCFGLGRRCLMYITGSRAGG